MKAKRLIRKPYFFDHAPYLQNMRYKTKKQELLIHPNHCCKFQNEQKIISFMYLLFENLILVEDYVHTK